MHDFRYMHEQLSKDVDRIDHTKRPQHPSRQQCWVAEHTLIVIFDALELEMFLAEKVWHSSILVRYALAVTFRCSETIHCMPFKIRMESAEPSTHYSPVRISTWCNRNDSPPA